MQSLGGVELERDNFKRQWQAEVQAHKDTVDRYNADKRSIRSHQEVSQEDSKGEEL